jgi:hypothetical protein
MTPSLADSLQSLNISMRSLPGREQSHSACWDAPLAKRSASSTLEGSAAKLHHAAAVVDREDDPAPGIRV